MRMDYCVYTHLRPDDSVFYVGKGIPSRPHRADGRNSQWKAEVQLHGSYSVNIVKSNLTEQEALDSEVKLIKMLRERGVSIVNMTRGGDGCKELIFTDEIREKLKIARSHQVPPTLGKKWGDELKQLWRSKRVGENNPMYGKKHTEETKAKYHLRKKPTYVTQTCPHCDLTGRGGVMNRWHMDSCKLKAVA